MKMNIIVTKKRHLDIEKFKYLEKKRAFKVK